MERYENCGYEVLRWTLKMNRREQKQKNKDCEQERISMVHGRITIGKSHRGEVGNNCEDWTEQKGGYSK